MTTAKLKWSNGLKFEGTSKFGLPIVTDGPKAGGGEESGYSPMELVLFGLAGCTGIDIKPLKIFEVCNAGFAYKPHSAHLNSNIGII